MAAQQLTLPEGPADHLNQGLFSDYFLNDVVPTYEGWLALENEARDVRARLIDILQDVDLTRLDEAQLEHQWIRPVLDALGHHYMVQVKIRYRRKGYRKPDYVLAPTQEATARYVDQIYEPDQLAGLLAVVDAKRHGVNLDQTGRGERNPSQQIDEYLRYSELPWGILTDGQVWRLYERQTSKNNVYYAVDLLALLEQDEIEPFLYFYAFFRPEAFTGDFLDRVLAGSVEYAQRVGDQLEEQVYEALELIAQGFLDYRRNDLDATPQTLHVIYQESLVFLYRVLFILYAESRDILPMQENREYREQRSLAAIKQEVVRRVNEDHHPDSTTYYSRLTDLFFAIDRGDARLALPAYNGRLFNGDEHPFLRDNKIGDEHLVPAIDRIARVEVRDPQNPRQTRLEFVDYRDLEVRHLGAIYEKLLEYQLDVADAPLAVSGDKYVEAGEGDAVVKEPGDVLLRTGSNERKVTGSYYTPDYIVRFIVERTLEPLLAAITERHAHMTEQGDWQIADGQADALRGAILDVNVLDPATGSGHFLVEATNYVAEWLRDLPLHPEGIERTEDELAYWKRQVVNACVYGVDINPLAVELAKLSLWLTTLAKGKPLSFLDHHIKAGNSLVGAWAREVGVKLLETPEQERKRQRKADRAEAAGQMLLFTDDVFSPAMSFAVEEMAAIEHIEADSVDRVKEQEQRYNALLARVGPWQRLADVYTARYFGLRLDQGDWKLVRDALLGEETPDNAADRARLDAIVAEAGAADAEQRFLHWELAFPEVFYQPDGEPKANPGFDAVIGNPPYVRQERIKPYKDFLGLKYQVYSGTADLFLYFFELGFRSLRRGERLGYITSGTYYNSNSAKEFRRYIDEATAFETVINFGENQPFKGAEMVYPTIAIMRKGEPKETFRSLFIEGTRVPASLDQALAEVGIDTLSDVTSMSEWRFQAREITELFRKIKAHSVSLRSIVGEDIYYGIKTGYNRAFIINDKRREELIAEDASSGKIIRSMRRGSHLRPWYQIDEGSYLVFTYEGIDIDNYPAVRNHLVQYREALEQRSEVDSGSCEWYELRPCTYYAEFKRPKILVPDIAKLPRFSWDEDGLFINDKATMIIPDSIAMLAILNSRVVWFAMSQIATPLRLRAGLWQYQAKQQFVKRLPIPDISSNTEFVLAEIAEEVTALARDRYQLHEQVRNRLSTDFGAEGGKLNTRMQEWWRLRDMAQFQREVKKSFGISIPVGDRDGWEKYLTEQQDEHKRLTGRIVNHEQRLNEIVYEAFDLTDEEIGLIEAKTKYPYGAV